jgi:hypothetical protein
MDIRSFFGKERRPKKKSTKRELPFEKFTKDAEQLPSNVADVPWLYEFSDVEQPKPSVEVDGDQTCSICLEGFSATETVKKIPCNHFYHEHCINEWLHSGKDTCPMCRHPFLQDEIGKWMLFYDQDRMDAAWVLAKNELKAAHLQGVVSIKCSTSFKNERASTSENGIIIFYCTSSSNEREILGIGANLLEKLSYTEQKIIYYKTDSQTREGTRSSGV